MSRETQVTKNFEGLKGRDFHELGDLVILTALVRVFGFRARAKTFESDLCHLSIFLIACSRLDELPTHEAAASGNYRDLPVKRI